MLCYITLNYIIWYDICYDMIWYDMIWYDMISYYIILYYIILYYIILYYIILYYIILYYIILYYIILYYIILYYIRYDIYLLTEIMFSPGSSSTVHSCTQTTRRTTHLPTIEQQNYNLVAAENWNGKVRTEGRKWKALSLAAITPFRRGLKHRITQRYRQQNYQYRSFRGERI